jgi:hypothetical protein
MLVETIAPEEPDRRSAMKVMKAVEVMPGEAAKMVAEDGVDCAWQGCDSHFKGDKPAGWVNLLTWWSPWPEPWRTVGEVAHDPSCKANAVLCPKHSARGHVERYRGRSAPTARLYIEPRCFRPRDAGRGWPRAVLCCWPAPIAPAMTVILSQVADCGHRRFSQAIKWVAPL